MEKTYINGSLGCKLTFKTYEHGHEPNEYKIITHYDNKINIGSFDFESWMLKVMDDWAQVSGIEFEKYLQFEPGTFQYWKFKPGHYAELLEIVDEDLVIPK